MQIKVCIDAEDILLHAGIREQLRNRSELRVSTPGESPDGSVAVIAFDSFGTALMRSVRKFSQSESLGIVLVLGSVDESSIAGLASSGANAIIRRRNATPDVLTETISGVARGEGSIPGDLAAHLMNQLKHCSRYESGVCTGRGSKFTERERQALSRVADGYSTLEIAREMGYSERTVKMILSGVVKRFKLRNRTHAVAHAIRENLI
ncbi:response regulator transcription factor [Streptomyces lavendulae]|uniref:response regulator transcription factor n=1 Tax=Streptomyces lavendulae TaxID=1914 RepID=UPI0031E7011D